tara:strand:- start:196 stop:372 length:177 start_codon:yes stop_codon:yes gene_type:complete
VNSLLTSTSCLCASVAQIVWNPRLVIPTLYVFGKAKMVLIAPKFGAHGLNSRDSFSSL